MLTAEHIRQGLQLLAQPRVVIRRKQRVPLVPRVVVEDGRAFLTPTHQAEVTVAEHLLRLLDGRQGHLEVPADVFGSTFTPDESQRAAVELAASSGVVVLTGGPGTGKTTVAKAMLSLYEAAGLRVVCAAPTGKAAQRMCEQTGRAASTIHRLIGLRPGETPRHHAGAPITCGAAVLDETSMVDAKLAAAVLSAIPTGARLLIIGDVDQLPSIGAGRVLYDLIESGTVPTVRLTRIHRQASESRIPYVARDINQGNCPDLSVTGSDVTHWETANPEQIAERIVRAVTDALPAQKGFAPNDIQVLASQYDDRGDETGPCGVVGLNHRLQSALNPASSQESDVFIGRRYSCRAADRVIHIRNNYDLGVMNGEIGQVVAADPQGLAAEGLEGIHRSVDVNQENDDPDADETDEDENDFFDNYRSNQAANVKTVKRDGREMVVFQPPIVLAVRFEDGNGGRLVGYTREEAKELELAYAISVHKSQGSQFRAVIVACPARHGYMLTRALLYTAVTRAAEFCLLVGEGRQIARSARNTRGSVRRTSLQMRLRGNA